MKTPSNKYLRVHFYVFLFVFITIAPLVIAQKPERAILFIVDGLHWEAPEKLQLSHLNQLIREGTYVPKACLLMSYHPLTGDWSQLHNSSMPNPIMVSGSLFITPGHKMIQEMFPKDILTGHATNSTAYLSIDRGTNISFIQDTWDQEAIRFAEKAMQNKDIKYLRIHLQDVGTGGWQCSIETEDVPWKRNIWAKGSPYIENAHKADALLGRFVQALKDMDKWEDTLFVVTADHGQSVTGWHPPLDPAGWYTPLLFVGPGIARGRKIEYAEHTDIIPTICHIMNIDTPVNEGAGRVLIEIFKDNPPNSKADTRRYTELINDQLTQYMRYKAKMLLSARIDPYLENVVRKVEREFYHLDRFLEWHKAGTLENLIEINQNALWTMRSKMMESPAANYLKFNEDVLLTRACVDSDSGCLHLSNR